MLNDMDAYAFIAENWLLVTSFISGVVAGNPRTVKKLLGIFTFMFGLYRVYIFMRELRNPEFRTFLLRVFISSFLVLTLLFFLIAASGCASAQQQADVSDAQFPLFNSLSNDSNIKAEIKPTSLASPVKESNTAMRNYLDSFAKLAKGMKVKRKIINNKHKRLIAEQDSAFKSERAAARKSRVVSCNINVSALRIDNKLIALNSMDYAKTLMLSVKGKNITKNQILKLPLNDCEQYGLSFLFRLKHKGRKLSGKWLSCSKFPTIGIVSADKKNALVELAYKLKLYSSKFRNDYLAYYKCKSASKREYFNKLKMGLFPSRKLNE